jgi:hypothetical protein
MLRHAAGVCAPVRRTLHVDKIAAGVHSSAHDRRRAHFPPDIVQCLQAEGTGKKRVIITSSQHTAQLSSPAQLQYHRSCHHHRRTHQHKAQRLPN